MPHQFPSFYLPSCPSSKNSTQPTRSPGILKPLPLPQPLQVSPPLSSRRRVPPPQAPHLMVCAPAPPVSSVGPHHVASRCPGPKRQEEGLTTTCRPPSFSFSSADGVHRWTYPSQSARTRSHSLWGTARSSSRVRRATKRKLVGGQLGEEAPGPAAPNSALGPSSPISVPGAFVPHTGCASLMCLAQG